MKSHHAKLIGVALLYGGGCFLAQWGLSVLGWRLFPGQPGDDELIQQMRWASHVVVEKILGLVLLCVAAFLAGRSHRPSWKLGILTAIATAVAYQFIAVVVYFLRFGSAAYQEYHDLVWTMLWTVGLAWFFGYLAVRKQYLYDRQVA